MCLDKKSKSESGDMTRSPQNDVSVPKDSMTFEDQSNETMSIDDKQSKAPQIISAALLRRKDGFSTPKDVIVKDAEHSSTSCSGSEADLSDGDKLEVNDNRQCPVCYEKISNPAEYTLHLKKHTVGCKCLVCDKILSSANSLDRHLLVHSGEKPFKCQDCGKAFTTNGNMNRHMKKRKHTNVSASNIPEKKARMVIANPCNEIPNSFSLNESMPHNCDRCSEGFEDLVKTGLRPVNFELISRMDCERRRTCSLNTKQHRSSSDVESTGVCDTCGSTCLRMAYLHPEAHSKELFLCDDCGSGFISLPKYQLHKLSHNTSAEYHTMNTDTRNQEEKDRFFQFIGLILPLLKAESDAFDKKESDYVTCQKEKDEAIRPLKFDKISSSSPSSPPNDSLQATDASSAVFLTSKLSCSVTSPLSADRASPISNIFQVLSSPVEGSIILKENTAENELQCKECGKCFTSKKSLTKHSSQAHDKKIEYKCDVCGKVTTDKSTLKRHMVIHTGVKDSICLICNKDFTNEPNTKRHIKKKHHILTNQKKWIGRKSSEKPGTNDNTICHFCNEDLGDSKVLSQHINGSDCPGKPFICGICRTRCSTKNNCFRHLMHKHKLTSKNEARKFLIIERLSTGDKKINGYKLPKSKTNSDPADKKIVSDNDSLTESEPLIVEQASEENHDSTNYERIPLSANEMELNATAIDMSKNSSIFEMEDFSSYSNIDAVSQRPSSIEVDVSYSMLRLSEELPNSQKQQEPLDLSLRPIDLSAKIKVSKQNCEIPHSSFYSHSRVPPPAHTSSPVIKPTSHYSFLSFIHTTPNVPITQSAPESEMLIMTKTQHPLNIDRLLMTSPTTIKQTASFNKNFFVNYTEDSCDSEKELRIVEDTGELLSENISVPKNSRKQHTSDSEINDLASVSSVIDTANSQDISKFLNPVKFSKTHCSEPEPGTQVPETSGCKKKPCTKKKCPYYKCDKSFDTPSALKRHRVIHTKEKSFACSICGKAFNTKSNCKRHKDTHLVKNSQQKPKDSSNDNSDNSCK